MCGSGASPFVIELAGYLASLGPLPSKYEPFPDLSAYACQIWSWFDGRVGEKKKAVQTHKGTLQLYIVDYTVAMSQYSLSLHDDILIVKRSQL